MFCILETLMF